MAWGSAYSPDFRAATTTGAALMNTAQANDRRLVEAAAAPSSLAFNVDAIDTGRYAVRCDSTSTPVNISLALVAASSRYAGALCRFARVSGSATSQVLVTIVASTTTDNVRVRIGNTGLLGYSMNNGTSYTDTGTNVNTGVHQLEVYVDWNVGTTHTLKIRCDNVEIVNTTGGASTVTASTTAAPVQWGGQATTVSVIDFADLVTYNDSAQYGVLTNWRVVGLEPTADGTHSFTDNDFQDAAAANITAANVAAKNTWDYVNDAPGAAPDLTAFVQQVVIAATHYMEWQLRALPSGYQAPVLVCLAAAVHPVGAATANSSQFRLVSGANASAETAIDASVASNTLEYRKHHYTTEPGGAAWTLAMVQAPLRARFGYSGDATPPPAIDTLMAFVVAQVLVSGTATGTSATSASAAGVASNHLISGTAAGTSATSASATGAASAHQYSGVATGTSATSAAATGTATHHQYSGSATGAVATSAAATGVATHHQFSGSATATSTTSASAAGEIIGEGQAIATSATSATASGTITRHGVATSDSLSNADAIGIASPHQYPGTATGTSATSATAVGVVSGGVIPVVSGRAGGQTWREPHYPRFGEAVGTSDTWAHAYGRARPGKRQRDDEELLHILQLV